MANNNKYSKKPHTYCLFYDQRKKTNQCHAETYFATVIIVWSTKLSAQIKTS